jgi:hypothetical protein
MGLINSQQLLIFQPKYSFEQQAFRKVFFYGKMEVYLHIESHRMHWKIKTSRPLHALGASDLAVGGLGDG